MRGTSVIFSAILGATITGAAAALAAAPPTTQPDRPPSGSQSAQDSPPPQASGPVRTPGAALDHAIRQLIEEAKQARQIGVLPRATPDIADSIDVHIPTMMLKRRLTRRVSGQPVVDAYVRWQLTSLAHRLPDLDDREFARFLGQLPALVENPRADETVMRRLRLVAEMGTLQESALGPLSADLDELALRDGRATGLNVAALGLRDWVEKQLPETGPRRLQADLERCAALIEAGWPVDQLKGRIEARLEAQALDPDLSPDDRRRLAESIDHLVRRSRTYVSSARLNERALTMEYGVSAVYDFEARRWQKQLARR